LDFGVLAKVTQALLSDEATAQEDPIDFSLFFLSGLTTAVSDRRRPRRWSVNGATELLLSVELSSGTAVRSINFVRRHNSRFVHLVGVRASFHSQRLRPPKMRKASTLGHNGIG
jgi:hypothetical protein